MKYYTHKTVNESFEKALEQITEALKNQGFGILSDIDVQATLKKKLNVDRKKYRILGACNPPNAHKALGVEPFIGLMLPCNVVLQEIDANTTDIAVVDPVASMQAVENDDLKVIAADIRDQLKKALSTL
ncbi:MAG: DUF302 domain-containing protein [Bacteroidales bacterium]